MLQRTDKVTLAVLRAMDIAVDGKDLICSVIDSGIADKRATHIVVLNIPETAHLNPLAAANLHHLVIGHKWCVFARLGIGNSFCSIA